MSDIFLSYSSHDRARAEVLAGKLEERGFTVWWDRTIPPGQQFAQVIEQALADARCIIVLWSEASVQSQWVKDEAQRGASRGILVPVLIDQVALPLGFGQIEAAELWDWKGSKSDPEFVQLLQSLKTVVRPSRQVNIADIPKKLLKKTSWPHPSRKTVIGLWAALAVMVIGVSFAAWRFDDLPMFVKAQLSGHIREARQQLDSLRSDLTIQAVPDSARLAGFSSLLGLHQNHLVRDFTESEGLFISRTVDSLKAIWAGAKLANLRHAVMEDSSATNAEMLEEARALVAEHGEDVGVGRSFLDSVVGSLTAQVATYDSILSLQNAITIAEERDRWVAFQSLDRLRAKTPEDDVAAARIAEIDAAMEELTSVRLMTTCLSVRGRDCMGERDTFDAGEVYFWARLNVPRAQETVTLEWIGPGGEVLDSYAFRVTRSGGYRVYRSRSFEEPGQYEARLHNTRRHVIGRAEFEVR